MPRARKLEAGFLDRLLVVAEHLQCRAAFRHLVGDLRELTLQRGHGIRIPILSAVISNWRGHKLVIGKRFLLVPDDRRAVIPWQQQMILAALDVRCLRERRD
jgi:hypothetical protein